MHYRKYAVRSPRYSPCAHPARPSAQVLAAFSGAAKPLSPPPPPTAAARARRPGQSLRCASTSLAIDARQQVVALELQAANAALAAEEVRKQGSSLSRSNARACACRSWRSASAFRRRCSRSSSCRCSRPGLNLVEALQTLAEKEAHGERQEVLAGLLAAINRGEPFSQAVAAFPAAFLAALRGDHQGERAHRRHARGARPLHRLPGGARAGAQEDRLGEHLPGDPHGRRRAGDRLPHVLRGAALRARVRGHGEHPAVLLAAAARLRQFRRQQRGCPGFSLSSPLSPRRRWAFSRPQRRARWLNAQLWRIPAVGEPHEDLPARAPVPHRGHAAERRHPGGARARDGARAARGASAPEPGARRRP